MSVKTNRRPATIPATSAARRRRDQQRFQAELWGGCLLVLAAAGGWGSVPATVRAVETEPAAAAAASDTAAPSGVPAVDPSLNSSAEPRPVAAEPAASASASSSSAPTADALASPGAPSAPGSSPPPSDSDGVRSREQPRELSTEPLIDRPRVTFDRSKRPAWVEQPPVRTGELHTHTVSSGPFATQRAALEKLDEELQSAVRGYIEEYLEAAEAGRQIVYSPKEIRQRLMREPVYLEYGEFEGLGTMQDAHAQLVFDEKFRQELAQRWQRLRTLARLINFAGLSAGVVLLLGVTWVVLRKKSSRTSAPVASLKLSTSSAILTLVAVALVAAWRIWSS
ncbi:MAG: hypothetical protein U0935_08345 [Pirellulales bacterium]